MSFTTTTYELWTWIYTLYGSISLPLVNDTIEREVARGSNVDEVSMQVNGERESKEKDKNQISKEEGTNELEGKTPKPQFEKHPEKGFPKEEVSKNNQIPEPTNSGSQKSIEKERPEMEIKSIFLKNEFYIEATHLLPLSNLKLPILQTPNLLTRKLTHKPISSTHLPFNKINPILSLNPN